MMTAKKIRFDKKDIVKFIKLSKKTRDYLFNTWSPDEVRVWIVELDRIIEIVRKQKVKGI